MISGHTVAGVPAVKVATRFELGRVADGSVCAFVNVLRAVDPLPETVALTSASDVITIEGVGQHTVAALRAFRPVTCVVASIANSARSEEATLAVTRVRPLRVDAIGIGDSTADRRVPTLVDVRTAIGIRPTGFARARTRDDIAGVGVGRVAGARVGAASSIFSLCACLTSNPIT